MSIIKRPSVGAIGSFSVSQPFNTIVDVLKEYRVEAIRSIQDMIDGNENPLQTIYKDVGLSEADMKNDIDNNIHIVVLSDSSNKYAYVPENRFISMPDVTGIRYQEKVLGVNLGLINMDYDLTPLIDDIKSLIQERIGVISNVKTIEASAIMRLPKQDHDNLVSARNALIKVNPGYYYKYKECLERNKLVTKANTKLAKSLSKYLAQDMVEVGYRFEKALNLNNTFKDYKLRLHADMKIENNNIFTEISVNEYCVYDDKNKYLRIIRYDNSSVQFINQTQLNLTYDRLGIYIVNDKIIVVYIDANEMKGIVFNNDLELLENFTIYTNKNNIYKILPIQISDNELIIGTTYSNQAHVLKITYSNSISVYDYVISNITIDSTPLDNGIVFNIVVSTNSGFINYNDYMCKISTNSDFTSFSIDGNFSQLHRSKDIMYFLSTKKNNYICIFKDINSNNLYIGSVDENHNTVQSFINTELDYFNTSLSNTLGRSLIFAYSDTDTSISLKRYD